MSKLKKRLKGSDAKSVSAPKAKTKKKVSKKAKAKKEKPSEVDDDVVRLIARVKGSKSTKGLDIVRASDVDVLSDVTEWVSTGFAGVDEIFGGGLPVGRVSEVFGAEGSGKTALSVSSILACQRAGGVGVFFDYEHSVSKEQIIAQGVDPTRLIYLRPDHIEAGWDAAFEMFEELEKKPPTAPWLFVWDSFGASQPKSIFEADSQENNHVGSHARAIGNGCMLMFGRIARVRAHMMCINQERTVIGGNTGFGGPPLQTTGGKAKLYTFALRARTARVSTLKTEGTTGTASGYLCAVATKKNKCAPPHQQARFVLDFKHGPSPSLTMRQVLKDAGKVRHKGAGKYTGTWAGGRVFGKGDEWIEALQEDPELRDLATQAYLSVVRAGGAKAALKIEEESAD
jgi:recombination protein RecA